MLELKENMVCKEILFKNKNLATSDVAHKISRLYSVRILCRDFNENIVLVLKISNKRNYLRMLGLLRDKFQGIRVGINIEMSQYFILISSRYSLSSQLPLF